MKIKIVLSLFLLYTILSSQEIVITEKQGFNFSTIIKTNTLKKIQPIENLIINIKGTPYSEVKVTLDDYYEVGENVYIGDVVLLTNKDLILDRNGEIDVEIGGNLYINERTRARVGKERFKSPIRVEYK
ncbi:MAG: hypothetical protein ACRC8F_06905 [Cetobacterium sp.]